MPPAAHSRSARRGSRGATQPTTAKCARSSCACPTGPKSNRSAQRCCTIQADAAYSTKAPPGPTERAQLKRGRRRSRGRPVSHSSTHVRVRMASVQAGWCIGVPQCHSTRGQARGWALRMGVCGGLTPPTCTRTGAHRAHICTGNGLALPTSASGLGSPLPHLHRDLGRRSTRMIGSTRYCALWRRRLAARRLRCSMARRGRRGS